MANNKAKRNSKARERAGAKPAKTRSNMYLWIAVVGLGGLVVGLIFSNKHDRGYEDRSYGAGTRNVAAAPAIDPNDPMLPLVQDVARHFLCGCGQCGDMPLVECVCGMSNGGVAEKNFIRDQLAAGYPVEEVIAMVERRYGRRIAPTENSIGTEPGATDSFAPQSLGPSTDMEEES